MLILHIDRIIYGDFLESPTEYTLHNAPESNDASIKLYYSKLVEFVYVYVVKIIHELMSEKASNLQVNFYKPKLEKRTLRDSIYSL